MSPSRSIFNEEQPVLFDALHCFPQFDPIFSFVSCESAVRFHSFSCRAQPDSVDVIYKSFNKTSFFVHQLPTYASSRFPSTASLICHKLKISRIFTKSWMPDEKLIKNFLHTLAHPLSISSQRSTLQSFTLLLFAPPPSKVWWTIKGVGK